MILASLTLKEDYWGTFQVQEDDIDVLYTHLLELETPLKPAELVNILIDSRLIREKKAAEKKRKNGGKPYLPKDDYKVGEKLVFPSKDFQVGEVVSTREGRGLEDITFNVMEVKFEDGDPQEFVFSLEDHQLNNPPDPDQVDPALDPEYIIENHGEELEETIVQSLTDNDDFVYIAGRWFPKALIVDVDEGNLNLAEAVLVVEEGGPMPTKSILEQVEMPSGINQNLAEFSLDLALQNDPRFDEVGSAGEVAWFIKKMEPEYVLETPLYLQYRDVDYDSELLTDQMLELEKRLGDEYSSLAEEEGEVDECTVSLIYPHWRAGTLPLTSQLAKLFPTAYESSRVRLMLVDGNGGDNFPAWVVRKEKYVYGLREWYLSNGVMPGSIIHLKRGENSGEVIIKTESHISAKEWVRTALIGADGGVVYAMLKQNVATSFDDWMMISMPAETPALEEVWEKHAQSQPAFEQVVVDTLRELAKLNPQSHVHVAELYSAVNVVFRCPPAPIMGLLASRTWFTHVGDLHYRFEDS